MSRGSPSMIALLGLLAVAGYQNRDKLGAMLQGAGARGGTGGGGTGGGRTGGGRDDDPLAGGGIMGDLNRMLTGGGGLGSGLSEILGRFSNPAQAAKAQSWVGTGPNSALQPTDLEEVLDEDTIADLTAKTGLGRSELLSRLSEVLPEAVDQLTPGGKLPTADEARGIY